MMGSLSNFYNPDFSNIYNSLYYYNLQTTNYDVSINQWSNLLADVCLNSLLITWASFVVILYYATWGVQMSSFNTSSVDTFSEFFACLAEIDDDIGPLDDMLHYAAVCSLIVVWFFCFTLFFVFYSKSLSWTFMLFQLILALLIVIPFSLFYSFGFSFVTFLRGCGKSNSIIVELSYDLLSISSLLVRYLVQHLRFIFIFMAFFDLFELVYNNLDLLGVSFVSQIFAFKPINFNLFSNNYWYDWLGDLVNTHLLLFYYAAHLTYTFIIQIMNYVSLTVFLVCFLYTGFISDTYENYFANLRLKV